MNLKTNGEYHLNNDFKVRGNSSEISPEISSKENNALNFNNTDGDLYWPRRKLNSVSSELEVNRYLDDFLTPSTHQTEEQDIQIKIEQAEAANDNDITTYVIDRGVFNPNKSVVTEVIPWESFHMDFHEEDSSSNKITDTLSPINMSTASKVEKNKKKRKSTYLRPMKSGGDSGGDIIDDESTIKRFNSAEDSTQRKKKKKHATEDNSTELDNSANDRLASIAERLDEIEFVEVPSGDHLKKKKRKHIASKVISENPEGFYSDDGTDKKKKKKKKKKSGKEVNEHDIIPVKEIPESRAKKKKNKKSISEPDPREILMSKIDNIISKHSVNAEDEAQDSNIVGSESSADSTQQLIKLLNKTNNSSSNHKDITSNLLQMLNEKEINSKCLDSTTPGGKIVKNRKNDETEKKSKDSKTVNTKKTRSSRMARDKLLNGQLALLLARAQRENQKQRLPKVYRKNKRRRKSAMTVKCWGEKCHAGLDCYRGDVNDADIDYTEYIEVLMKQRQEEEQMANSSDKYEYLEGLKVHFPWRVPPQHNIETRIANSASHEQKAEIEKLGVKIKNGIFTKPEDDTILQNFRTFCRIHNIPEDATPFLSFKKKAYSSFKLDFVRFLAHGLDDRLLHSVYSRFRRIFNNSTLNSGKFSPREDKIIMHFMEQALEEGFKNPYASLAKILKRDRLAIEKHFIKLFSSDEETRWDDNNAKKLVKGLMNVTGSKQVEDLKELSISLKVWHELSKKLNIPHWKLKRGWDCTIYPRLFAEKHSEVVKVKKKIVKLLRKLKYNDWRSIDWDLVASKIPGYTAVRLNKMFKELVSYCVPNAFTQDLPDTLQFLADEVLPNHTFRKINIKVLKLDET